jgi:hypothetical protein
MHEHALCRAIVEPSKLGVGERSSRRSRGMAPAAPFAHPTAGASCSEPVGWAKRSVPTRSFPHRDLHHKCRSAVVKIRPA